MYQLFMSELTIFAPLISFWYLFALHECCTIKHFPPLKQTKKVGQPIACTVVY